MLARNEHKNTHTLVQLCNASLFIHRLLALCFFSASVYSHIRYMTLARRLPLQHCIACVCLFVLGWAVTMCYLRVVIQGKWDGCRPDHPCIFCSRSKLRPAASLAPCAPLVTLASDCLL